MVVSLIAVAVTYSSDFTPALSNDFLDIQASTERELTLERVHDMIRTYSQMHPIDKYTQ